MDIHCFATMSGMTDEGLSSVMSAAQQPRVQIRMLMTRVGMVDLADFDLALMPS